MLLLSESFIPQNHVSMFFVVFFTRPERQLPNTMLAMMTNANQFGMADDAKKKNSP